MENMNARIKSLELELNELKTKFTELESILKKNNHVKRNKNKQFNKIKLLGYISKDNITKKDNMLVASNDKVEIKIKDSEYTVNNYVIKNGLLIKTDKNYTESDIKSDKQLNLVNLTNEMLQHMYQYVCIADLKSGDDKTEHFYCKIKNNKLTMIICDTYRLVKKDFTVNSTGTVEGVFIVPAQIIKALKELKANEVNVKFNDDIIMLDGVEGVSFSYKNNIIYFPYENIVDQYQVSNDKKNIIEFGDHIKTNIAQLIKSSKLNVHDKNVVELVYDKVFDGVEWRNIGYDTNQHIAFNPAFIAPMLKLDEPIYLVGNSLVIQSGDIYFVTMLCIKRFEK